MVSALPSALAFTSRGHAILPLFWPVERNGKLICSCKRGADCGASSAKHPYGPLASGGLLDATLEPAVVKLWFGGRAPEANLGVRTERLLVLDVDPRHSGDESLADLERTHEPLPPTWRAITGGGGEHIIF